MLSSVLNSKTAIDVNIGIIRVFTRMREVMMVHKDVLIKLEQIEKSVFKQNAKLSRHDKDLQLVFKALKELLAPTVKRMTRIGFRQKDRQDHANP